MRTYRTIGEAWLNVNQLCLEHGRRYAIQRGSFEGTQDRAQLDQLAFIITNPGERPLGVEYQGHPISDDESIQRYFEDYIVSPQKSDGEDYTYGERLSPWLGEIAKMLRDAPHTNQAIISVATASDVLLRDPPCLREVSWKFTGKDLQLTTFWRSWDVYGALPSNLGAIQLLNEAMAEWVGLQPGQLVCYSDGAHVYSASWEVAPKAPSKVWLHTEVDQWGGMVTSERR